VAIFGLALTGKTSVAQAVSRRLHYPARHCGELVKQRAFDVGVTPLELAVSEHMAIDNDTRAWARDHIGVVEGRFLDRVLNAHPGVILVELTCGHDERVRRLVARMNLDAPKADATLHQRDMDDEALGRRLFGDGKVTGDVMRLDTSQLSVSGTLAVLLGE
jgi:cytidylate kinase